MADKILIVDDDEDLRSELKDFLEGYEVCEASSGEEALKLLKRAHEIGLMILDVMMPGISGLDVLAEIKKTDPGLGIIILTGHSSKDVAIEALKGRADDYIEKPIDIKRIKDAVERLLGARRGEGDMASLDLKGKMEMVKRFIERNCYKKITLKEAADAVCLSPKYLSRVFKECLRTGFNDYKLAFKIGKAKELLEKSGYNINQISDKLGYENAESFIRQFKKLCGRTPTSYRNKAKETKKKRFSKRLRKK
ncbi:MAG: response regulator [Candidatus Omnitrophica bacterium]|nr:response regulator [Candidatus Omnitrophota bacterium]